MRMGTRTVLYGFHQFALHPIFVAVAWTQLYGFPFDPRLWLAFFVHDLGYWGKLNLDDEDGETHPEFGAKVMSIFGPKWSDLVLLHSRFYAKRLGREPSRLCYADKLATCLCPYWLWRLLVTLTGEIEDYLSAPKYRSDSGFVVLQRSQLRSTYAAVVQFQRAYVAENAHRETGE